MLENVSFSSQTGWLTRYMNGWVRTTLKSFQRMSNIVTGKWYIWSTLLHFYTWFKFFLMSKYQNKGIGYLIVSSQDHLCTYVVYWMITNLEVCSPVRRWQISIASWVPQGSRWPSLWCPRRWGSGRWTPPTWWCRGWTSGQRPCCSCNRKRTLLIRGHISFTVPIESRYYMRKKINLFRNLEPRSYIWDSTWSH